MNIAHYHNIVLAKTGEFLLGFYEDSTISRFQFFKVCKENGQENSEFERETENKRVQEEKIEKKEKQLKKTKQLPKSALLHGRGSCPFHFSLC